MSQLQFLENRSNGTGQLAAKEYLVLREIGASDRLSDSQSFPVLSVSCRIYFSVRNDTATFSARISHRGIARRRDTARPSDETFRASSLLRRAFSTSRPPPSFLPACLRLVSSFVIFLARLEDPA